MSKTLDSEEKTVKFQPLINLPSFFIILPPISFNEADYCDLNLVNETSSNVKMMIMMMIMTETD